MKKTLKAKSIQHITGNPDFVFYDEDTKPEDIKIGDHFIHLLYEDESYFDIFESIFEDFNDYADIEYVAECKKIYAQTANLSDSNCTSTTGFYDNKKHMSIITYLSLKNVPKLNISTKIDEESIMSAIKIKCKTIKDVKEQIALFEQGLNIESIDVTLKSDGSLTLDFINYK